MTDAPNIAIASFDCSFHQMYQPIDKKSTNHSATKTQPLRITGKYCRTGATGIPIPYSIRKNVGYHKVVSNKTV